MRSILLTWLPGATVSTIGMMNLAFANSGDVLNLVSGGLVIQNLASGSTGSANIGTTTIPGMITAGGATPAGPTDLYLYYYNTGGNALTINSAIVDNPNNGGVPVRLILWGGGVGSDTGSATIIWRVTIAIAEGR